MTTRKVDLNFTSADLLSVLQNHIGKRNGIRADVLAEKLSGTPLNKSRSQRRLRTLVVLLRERGHHVCATPSHGYYIAANEAELDETCTFLVDRAMSSLKQVSRMKKVSLPDLHGQMKLPT